MILRIPTRQRSPPRSPWSSQPTAAAQPHNPFAPSDFLRSGPLLGKILRILKILNLFQKRVLVADVVIESIASGTPSWAFLTKLNRLLPTTAVLQQIKYVGLRFRIRWARLDALISGTMHEYTTPNRLQAWSQTICSKLLGQWSKTRSNGTNGLANNNFVLFPPLLLIPMLFSWSLLLTKLDRKSYTLCRRKLIISTHQAAPKPNLRGLASMFDKCCGSQNWV